MKDGTRCMGCSDAHGLGYLARPVSRDLKEERLFPGEARASAEAEAVMLCRAERGSSSTEVSMEWRAWGAYS